MTILTAAAGNDVITSLLRLRTETVIHALRVSLVVLPVLVRYVTARHAGRLRAHTGLHHMQPPYPPINDYAFLSDCHSAALVSRDASIDWACPRRFDSDSVFGRILDWEGGGFFSITAADLAIPSRRYVGDSLVLETTLRTPSGAVRILDAFSMHRGGARAPHNQLLRIVEGVEGTVDLSVTIAPRFAYGELRLWLRQHGEGATYSAVGGDTALIIQADRPLEIQAEHCQPRPPPRRARRQAPLRGPVTAPTRARHHGETRRRARPTAGGDARLRGSQRLRAERRSA